MKILVVDDERTFGLSLKALGDVHDYYKDDTIVYARDYYQAVDLLEQPWDIVYLDHDLGMSLSGGELARTIEKEAIQYGTLFDIGKFVIHTANPIGRMEMYQALSKFYNVEFARAEDLMK